MTNTFKPFRRHELLFAPKLLTDPSRPDASLRLRLRLIRITGAAMAAALLSMVMSPATVVFAGSQRAIAVGAGPLTQSDTATLALAGVIVGSLIAVLLGKFASVAHASLIDDAHFLGYTFRVSVLRPEQAKALTSAQDRFDAAANNWDENLQRILRRVPS